MSYGWAGKPYMEGLEIGIPGPFDFKLIIFLLLICLNESFN
ncbi:hypothetical protein [Methanobrevibacter sp.]